MEGKEEVAVNNLNFKIMKANNKTIEVLKDQRETLEDKLDTLERQLELAVRSGSRSGEMFDGKKFIYTDCVYEEYAKDEIVSFSEESADLFIWEKVKVARTIKGLKTGYEIRYNPYTEDSFTEEEQAEFLGFDLECEEHRGEWLSSPSTFMHRAHTNVRKEILEAYTLDESEAYERVSNLKEEIEEIEKEIEKLEVN